MYISVVTGRSWWRRDDKSNLERHQGEGIDWHRMSFTLGYNHMMVLPDSTKDAQWQAEEAYPSAAPLSLPWPQDWILRPRTSKQRRNRWSSHYRCCSRHSGGSQESHLPIFIRTDCSLHTSRAVCPPSSSSYLPKIIPPVEGMYDFPFKPKQR